MLNSEWQPNKKKNNGRGEKIKIKTANTTVKKTKTMKREKRERRPG